MLLIYVLIYIHHTRPKLFFYIIKNRYCYVGFDLVDFSHYKFYSCQKQLEYELKLLSYQTQHYESQIETYKMKTDFYRDHVDELKSRIISLEDQNKKLTETNTELVTKINHNPGK